MSNTNFVFLVPNVAQDFFLEDDYNGIKLWWDASALTLTQYDCVWGEDGDITETKETQFDNIGDALKCLQGWLNCEAFGFKLV